MKMVVVWIVGSLLICAAAAAGYYVGKTERGDADPEQLTRKSVKSETNMAEVLNSTDARGDSKTIITFDLDNYVLARKSLPASSVHRSDHQCVLDDYELMVQLGSALTGFENCPPMKAKP
jgi:hypothetical protein